MATKRTNTKPKADLYQTVTDKIVASMEGGQLPPWRRTWAGGGRPTNLASGKAYKGINVFLLAFAGYTSPYWVTFKQALDLGGNVRKGEKSGNAVVFFRKVEKEDKNGKVNSYPLFRSSPVFNLEQCDGLKAPEVETVGNSDDPIEACETIVMGYPLPKPAMDCGKPSYAPFMDTIRMPARESFTGIQEFYSTLFHEMAHSTGHVDRLDRDLMRVQRFGSEDYSFEELVAEFTASFLCAHAGISPAVLDNQAAYIAGWKSKIRSDPKLVIGAASKAQKAADYILGVQAD